MLRGLASGDRSNNFANHAIVSFGSIKDVPEEWFRRQPGAPCDRKERPLMGQSGWKLFLSILERCGNHRRECLFGASANGAVPGLQIMADPLRCAFDHGEDR